jgi:hypothetical protein
MIPPGWALKDSRRLDIDEFQSQFSAAWSSLAERFLKLECWQAYQEIAASGSQAAYNRGEIIAAQVLLREEAEADRPLYEDIKERGVDYARIRLIQEPLTSYLTYELVAYEIRAAMGENIEVVRYDASAALPSEEYFDFLLFDRKTALIHDYGAGEVGCQVGGWVTHDAGVIASLDERASQLRRSATPLPRFLAVLQG